MDPYKYLDEYEVRKQSTPNATEAQKVTSPAIWSGSCRSVRKILPSVFLLFFFQVGYDKND